MEINVSQLLKAPTGATQDYEVSEVLDITGGGGSLVQGKVALVRTGRGILVRATLHAEVEVSCSRCLNLFNCSLVLKIEEEYLPIVDINTGAPLSLSDEPGSFTISENHVLDLTEAIRQYTLLVIPMKPLCRKDCAGMCPTCGQDLNQGACTCPPKGADPRWSKLRQLISSNDVPLNERRQ